MQKQENQTTEQPVDETVQEAQENGQEQRLPSFPTLNKIERKYKKITPPTKMAWDVRDILFAIVRLQGILSQEDLWRGPAITLCVDRIRKAAERLGQYFS